MAKADLGVKRVCLSCGMRFYDFKRTPIVCPGCSTEFDPENPVRSRKSRAVSKSTGKSLGGVADDADNLDLMDDDDLDNETVMIAKSKGDNDDDDIDFDDDDIDIDDADGPGIIQDDLGDDDELLPNLDEKDD
jgi:uncharacterized protein (TIGR02300 family)